MIIGKFYYKYFRKGWIFNNKNKISIENFLNLYEKKIIRIWTFYWNKNKWNKLFGYSPLLESIITNIPNNCNNLKDMDDLKIEFIQSNDLNYIIDFFNIFYLFWKCK